MADTVAATFRRPFVEQVAALRLRLGNRVPTSAWDDLIGSMHDRSFMVAGATNADLLADLARAVDSAVTDGTTFEQFKRDFRQIVSKRGWHGWTGEGTLKGEEWRMRTIYRTNMRTSYMAGRFAQLVEGKYKYWVYRHSGAVHPRLDHLSWDGVALSPDHPFWQTHYPPNGWGCGCIVRGANSARRVKRVGGDLSKQLPDNWEGRDPRTGAPDGIGKHWDYAPGASAIDDLLSLRDKLPILPASLGSEMFDQFPQQALDQITAEFRDFVEQSMKELPTGKALTIGALRPEWIRELRRAGRPPATAEIVVTDRDILHSFRRAKHRPVPLEWYNRVPELLRNPSQILLDTTGSPDRPRLLLIFEGDGTRKLVLNLDYLLRKPARSVNLLRTAQMLNESDIRSLLGKSTVRLIEIG